MFKKEGNGKGTTYLDTLAELVSAARARAEGEAKRWVQQPQSDPAELVQR